METPGPLGTSTTIEMYAQAIEMQVVESLADSGHQFAVQALALFGYFLNTRRTLC